MNKKIKHNEAPSIKVAKFLILMGFYPATYNGIELEFTINSRQLGVLCNDPSLKSKKKHWLFSIFTAQKKRIFLGLVFFKDKSRGADINNWVFEVYEKEHIELAKQLTEEMSLFFDKKINVYPVDKKFAY